MHVVLAFLALSPEANPESAGGKVNQ